jgi:hypothetical protein
MNIYEQAAEQAKIDKQQQMLDKKVEYDLLKSHENRLVEKLNSLGIKYEKSYWYDFSEEKFLNHIHNGCTIKYDLYLYPEKVRCRLTWEMKYITEEIKLKRDGTYKFGTKDYSPESSDLEKIMESVIEKVMRTTKYNTNN